jgi:multidrug efflux pump subunit AcrB
MVRTRRRAALAVICLGAGLLISLGAGLLINSMRAAGAQEPPAFTVEAQFPGMPASVVEERVAFTLEAKINGVENLERLRSRCGRDGSYSLEIAFGRGTNPNLAQMLVQNRVNDAMPLLPEEVRRLGVTVRKASSVLVMLLTVSSTDGSVDISSDLNNFASVYIRPQLARMPGVAEVSLHGSDGFAARILLDPQKLAAHKLTIPDVKRAIEQQALEATSGPRGGFQFTPNARGGLTKLDQLASVAIKSDPNGTAIRIEDVKSIIRLSEDLVGFASLDGKPVAVLAVYAWAGAEPHAVSAAVRDQLREFRELVLPPGVELSGEFEFTAPATPGAPGHLLLDVNLRSARSKESPRELLARTDQLLQIPGVRHVLALSGQPFDRNPDQPCLVVGLGQADGAAVDRERILREIRTRFIATEKSAPIRMRDLSGYARSRGTGCPIEFALCGFDRQPLRELADTIVAQMSRDPRLTDAWAGPSPVLTYAVNIDRAKVARLGLALPDVSESLQAVFGSVQAGNLQAVRREWPILLKIDPAGRSEVERLVESHLRTAEGDLISLSEVAAVHRVPEPAYLERDNISPVIVITAGLDGNLSLAEARFLCERLVTDAIRERGRAAISLRWLRPMPPAKAPARSGGAPDRAGGP